MAEDLNLQELIELEHLEMDAAIEHLKKELAKVRAGKAAPNLVSDLLVDYYGSPTPVNQVSNITTGDSRTLIIQPWEKSMLAPIEKAIFEANLGLTPMNNGETIIISIPALTEERRKDLVKQVKKIAEDAKVSIRSVRHKIMEAIKKEVKNGYPEDAGKRDTDKAEEKVKEYISKVDSLSEHKEKDIMTV